MAEEESRETKPEKKRTVEEIDAEIEQVKKELEECKGSDCEVYTRIVGYYRALRNWNAGKREEYKERKVFVHNDEKERRKLTVAEQRLFERQNAEWLDGRVNARTEEEDTK